MDEQIFECEDCGFRFAPESYVDLGDYPPICPNCGGLDIGLINSDEAPRKAA